MTKRMMQQKKRIFSLILAIAMVVGIISPGSTTVVNAGAGYDGYVYVTVEKLALGQGLAAEPKKIGFYNDDTMVNILKRGFGDYFIGLDGGYISGLSGDSEPEGWTKNEIPSKILEAVGVDNIGKREKENELSNFDYTGMSGIMYLIDDMSASVGINQLSLDDDNTPDDAHFHDGSVLRFSFTIYGYGADVFNYGYGVDPLIKFSNKDQLVREIVDYTGTKSDKEYTDAVEVLKDWDATQGEVNSAITSLRGDEYKELLNETLAAEKQALPNPAYKDEWKVLSIARNGMSDVAWNHKYIHSVEKTLKELNSNILDKKKSTENSRVIIALTAVGADATDVAGYNLIEPLADYDYAGKQGANGLIYALIALDSGAYEIPTIKGEGTQTTREKLVEGLLNCRVKDGGWSWNYEADDLDVDTTCMAIQALAPYYKSDEDVKAAIDKVLSILSEKQDDNGEFYYEYYDTVSQKNIKVDNPCTTAQVLCGLSELGINADKDKRFVKNGKSVLDAVLSYYNESEKGFVYSLDSDKKDSMTTEQVLYALTAFDRMMSGKERLYDFSDVERKAYKTEIKDAKEPKCTEKGYTGDKVCVDCGEIVEKGQEIAAQGHKPVEIPAVAATETTAGKTAGKKCSVCGAIIEAQKDVPATGKKQETTQAPTTTAEAPKTVKDTYTVTSTDEKKQTVAYTGDDNSKAKKVTISDTVTDPDTKTTYKVTEVAENACKDNKNLTTVNIGKNVTKIGAGAFAGCTKLSKISVDGDSIKSIGKNSFKGIKKNATIKVSAKTKKQYKKIVKMIKKAGAKKAKFKFVKKTKKKATTKKK